jgi:hypothetical protein
LILSAREDNGGRRQPIAADAFYQFMSRKDGFWAIVP